MGRNKEESMNIRKIRRLLHETKKIAENASLTGSLQGGAKIAIRQYNAILNHLQETGAIPEDLFQTLDEDECSFDELGVTVAMLDGYLEEDEDESTTMNAESGGDSSGDERGRNREHRNKSFDRSWEKSWGKSGRWGNWVDPEEFRELRELGDLIRRHMPDFAAGFQFSSQPQPPAPPKAPTTPNAPSSPSGEAGNFYSSVETDAELRSIAEQLQREDLTYDERMHLTGRIVELTRR